MICLVAQFYISSNYLWAEKTHTNMGKFSKFLKTQFERLKANGKRGIEWVNIYGLANMSVSAILTIFLMLFAPAVWSMVFSMLIVMVKCLLDKKKGSGHELHDFICSVIGVIAGVILGVAHAAVVLL